jgi:tetratricopeptide (TPR) repeat protein
MTLNAQNSLAVLLQSQVRDEEADAVFASVLATAEAAAPDSEFTQIARVNLATSRQRLGRNEEAAALIERALAGLSKSLPPQHPTLLSMRLRLVHTLIDLRRLDEASALCAEVTAGMVRVLGRTHHETLLARSTAMMVALAQDDLDAAIEVLRGLVADEAEIGPRAASYRAGLGGLLLERGRPDEAEPHLRAFLASESVRADPDGWPALLAHNRLATIAGLRGAFADGAEAMAESCAKLPDRKLPKDSARGLDQVALALERGVAFYEAWDRAEPGRGHDAKAAAVRRQLDDRRAEAR